MSFGKRVVLMMDFMLTQSRPPQAGLNHSTSFLRAISALVQINLDSSILKVKLKSFFLA